MQPQAVALIVAVSSINALAYNVCHYLMIQRLSAVGTTVVGEVKIVGLMLLSAALLGGCGKRGGVAAARRREGWLRERVVG